MIMDRQRTHDWETHGKSNDIDESTPINKVKGPNVFERAKEEIEALVEALHPKRSPEHEHHERNYGNFRSTLRQFKVMNNKFFMRVIVK